MEKNVRLADIYVKIYNKQPLFMEDLAFLAKYDKECFEKTCRNLIYNIPEAKELLEPADGQELRKRRLKKNSRQSHRRQKQVRWKAARRKKRILK